MKKQKKTEKD